MDRSGGRACAGSAGSEGNAQGCGVGCRDAAARRNCQCDRMRGDAGAQLRLRDADFARFVGQCRVVCVYVRQRMRERRRLTEQQGQSEKPGDQATRRHVRDSTGADRPAEPGRSRGRNRVGNGRCVWLPASPP